MAKIPGIVVENYSNVDDITPAEANQIGTNIQQLKKWLDVIFNNHIVEGLDPALPVPASLDMTIPAGTVMFDGVVLTADAAPHTYPQMSDTYVDLSKTGVFTWVPVANGAAAPAVTANSVRLFIVVSGFVVSHQIIGITPILPRTIYAQLQRSPVVMEFTTASLATGNGQVRTFVHGLGTDNVRVVPMARGSLAGDEGKWDLSWTRPDGQGGTMLGANGVGGAGIVAGSSSGSVNVYVVNRGAAQTIRVTVAIYPEA